MKVVRTKKELAAELGALSEERSRSAGRRAEVGFVPTMGAIHEGHLALVREARATCEVVVLSIFVNPLQFGDGEDFTAYPRDEERDLELAASAGTDIAFLPEVEEMYPPGTTTIVKAPSVAGPLEGEARPGHFDGVCTVLAVLFNLVGCDRAFFGQKDAQQAAVVKRMVEDLSYRCRIVVCPTVRDENELALSSRNAYLSEKERNGATALYEALQEGRHELLSGQGFAAAEEKMWKVLDDGDGVEPEYARAVDPETFENPMDQGPVLLALAARVGRARLIDNLPVSRAEMERKEK